MGAYGTSFPEQFIYWCFKQIWDDAENRCHVLKTVQNPRGIEFDVGVPSIRLCIECSSTLWHKGKEEYDNYKKEVCKANNVRLINIIEYESSHMVEIVEDDDIYYIKNGAKQEELVKIIDEILKKYGNSIKEIDTDLAYGNAYKHSRTTLETGKSLKDVYPELAKEFNEKLNTVDIQSVSQRSGLEIYWTCTKCGYGQNGEWKVQVNRRTIINGETGCPRCKWNWAKQGYTDRSKNTKAIEGFNDLLSQEPELAKEYSAKNELKANEIGVRSSKRVLWVCPNCGYGKNGEWRVAASSRAYAKSGCPRCGYNWYKAQTGQPQKLKLYAKPNESKGQTDTD